MDAKIAEAVAAAKEEHAQDIKARGEEMQVWGRHFAELLAGMAHLRLRGGRVWWSGRLGYDCGSQHLCIYLDEPCIVSLCSEWCCTVSYTHLTLPTNREV